MSWTFYFLIQNHWIRDPTHHTRNRRWRLRDAAGSIQVTCMSVCRSFPSCSSNKIKINKRKIDYTFCKHSFISSLSATVSSHWRRRRFRCTLARFVVCTAEAWERGASFIIGVLFEHVGKSVKSSALDRSLKFPDSEVFLTYFLREKRCWIFEVVSCFYKCSIGACFELKFDFIFYFWKKIVSGSKNIDDL